METLAPFYEEINGFDPAIKEQLEVEAHYDGYLARQKRDIKTLRMEESFEIPTDVNYDEIKGLSNEVCEKLKTHTPSTLAAAGRISGVTPSALTTLWLHLKKAQA